MKLLTCIVFIAISCCTFADELQIPVGQQGIDGLELPSKGMTMAQVETAFGEAPKRHPARGQPPITRWEYSNFMVYFEGEHVIHSVLRHKPRAEFQTPTTN
ncbi:phosphodiesterase [Simiduia aestuariiviva]|uniref:Phosphodiesterase n=1 Tax=Simiduia aestuariiviva TaxID=1510459 RepID=A0A839UPT5_9GAMM|nr:phosphodiesterase [Simiduia aestuariiviva]MBB3168499.1 hypothetical protein [Simiduia aestuariiviva]